MTGSGPDRSKSVTERELIQRSVNRRGPDAPSTSESSPWRRHPTPITVPAAHTHARRPLRLLDNPYRMKSSFGLEYRRTGIPNLRQTLLAKAFDGQNHTAEPRARKRPKLNTSISSAITFNGASTPYAMEPAPPQPDIQVIELPRPANNHSLPPRRRGAHHPFEIHQKGNDRAQESEHLVESPEEEEDAEEFTRTPPMGQLSITKKSQEMPQSIVQERRTLSVSVLAHTPAAVQHSIGKGVNSVDLKPGSVISKMKKKGAPGVPKRTGVYDPVGIALANCLDSMYPQKRTQTLPLEAWCLGRHLFRHPESAPLQLVYEVDRQQIRVKWGRSPPQEIAFLLDKDVCSVTIVNSLAEQFTENVVVQFVTTQGYKWKEDEHRYEGFKGGGVRGKEILTFLFSTAEDRDFSLSNYQLFVIGVRKAFPTSAVEIIGPSRGRSIWECASRRAAMFEQTESRKGKGDHIECIVDEPSISARSDTPGSSSSVKTQTSRPERKPSSGDPGSSVAHRHSATQSTIRSSRISPSPPPPAQLDSDEVDDEQPLSFRELEDSDDGNLIDDLPLVGGAKRKSSLFPAPRPASDVSFPFSSVPSTFDDTTTGPRTRRASDRSSPLLRSTRASAKTRKPAAFHLPLTIAESSTFTGVKKSASFPLNRKKSQAMNPLYALLREKELEDKRGTSSAALRLAEEAVRQNSREASVNSDEESDTLKRSRLTDERAAWKAVRESRKSTSPGDSSDVEDFTIGDRESKMLGAVAGEAINKILAGDKDSKGKERAQDMEQNMTLGVSLWIRPSNEDMEVDPMSIPPLSGHPILACLDDSLKSGDDSLLDLTLRSGALAAVPRDILLSNMPPLLNMALFASSQVADAVSIALRDLWGLNPPKVHMPFAAILFALVRLGASPSFLEGLGLITEGARTKCITHETLQKALKRLLAIVKAAGCAGALSPDEVANVVLILVVLELDPLTSSELRTQLNITMDVICNHGATDYLLHDIHEKVLSLASRLVPVNKARLVSFFASGSGRTRCIARHLAYYLLVPTPISPNDQAPPLELLILLLSPDAGSCELFDVTNESTNYEELRHYVNILSVALIDIAPYVEEERAIMKSASVHGSPDKPEKPPAPPLELLRRVLEVLHSKIVDTRAAHLDRSRTKAAIQHLTMRIRYDRMAL